MQIVIPAVAAEGIYTVNCVVALARKHGIDLPWFTPRQIEIKESYTGETDEGGETAWITPVEMFGGGMSVKLLMNSCYIGQAGIGHGVVKMTLKWGGDTFVWKQRWIKPVQVKTAVKVYGEWEFKWLANPDRKSWTAEQIRQGLHKKKNQPQPRRSSRSQFKPAERK